MMRLSGFEREILAELRTITGRKLKGKDLLEWSCSEAEVLGHLQLGDEIHYCKSCGVWAAIPEKKKS